MTDGDTREPAATLLASDEPRPFTILNAVAEAPVLLVCDHASCRFPAALDNLGLDPFARRCHLAVDIGAGPVTEQLSRALGVTAVVAGYSRLVVDCNRNLMDPSAFLEYGDGILVPGNRGLRRADRERRAAEIYWPYHSAIDAQLQRLSGLGPPPIFIAVHSFTPVLNGESRPWQMGILWDTDTRLRDILLADLTAAGFVVGDNEPYSGKAPADFTIDNHAEPAGLPHVGLEIRQDLVSDADGIVRIAELLGGIVASMPERIGYSGQRVSA